jgi:hypothetical protein
MDTPIERPAIYLRPPVAAPDNLTVDGSRVRDSDLPSLLQRGERSYYAEIRACQVDQQSLLIEQVIAFALDMLGARHLDVRVRPAEG